MTNERYKTVIDSVRGLVELWTSCADIAAADGDHSEAFALRYCAAELNETLAQPAGERCKTVIVYGDHGPEEREPVEDYYDAPQQPAGEAVMWRVRTKLGSWMYFDHKPEHIANAEPLFTTPTPSAVEALARAAKELRERQRAYLAGPKGDRSEEKGRAVGFAAEDLDAALAHPEIAALLKGEKA